MRLLAWLPALALCAGCAAVSSSAYVPAPTGAAGAARSADAPAPVPPAAVAVWFTRDPPGAEEIAVVEAHGACWYGSAHDTRTFKSASGAPRPRATLGAIVAELRSRVATVGGDAVRVDGFDTRYEKITEPYTYGCAETATPQSGPQTATPQGAKLCSGYREFEAATLTLSGRAFRTKGGHR